MQAYPTSMTHLLAEMEAIDLLIQMQVWQARQSQTLDNEFAGLVLTDTEIDHLLAQPVGAPRWVQAQDVWTASEAQSALANITEMIAQRRQASIEQGVLLRLALLQDIFGLTPIATRLLLICLAPELDSRYSQLYAYLQNDVNKKYPSVDLVLNLVCANFEEKVHLRQWFNDASPLIRYRLISLEDESQQFLNTAIKGDRRIVNFLIESDHPASQIQAFINMIEPKQSLDEMILADDLHATLTRLSQLDSPMTANLTVYLQGHYGIGRQTSAEALCATWRRRLIVVDTPQLIDHPQFEQTVRLILREALLTGSVLYWDSIDTLLDDKHASSLKLFFEQFEVYRGLMFLSSEQSWYPRNQHDGRQFVRLDFPQTDFSQRLALWQYLLPTADDSLNLSALANNFRFTAGQIHDVILTAQGLARLDNPRQPTLTHNHLQQACQRQSNRRLSTLAQPITGKYKWDDIVLPKQQKELLREIHNQVHHRWRVFQEWGFDRKLSLGKGLNVLFAGPSGTGKTMAAGIIAKSLGFHLYKIDLSTVVSKYIGETEKHLAQIFNEAQSSNAILFFDEADAIFGKRSEVSDAQDRFANIQVSFLLQRMEEYDGMVILTSNLRKNMDEAFVRRMHFIVEFPFPSADYREQIWRHVFPHETPLNEDINWAYLAKHFDLTGGNIRNIALAAAFFAVEDNSDVTMQHLLRGINREYQKMGKIIREIQPYI